MAFENEVTSSLIQSMEGNLIVGLCDLILEKPGPALPGGT